MERRGGAAGTLAAVLGVAAGCTLIIASTVRWYGPPNMALEPRGLGVFYVHRDELITTHPAGWAVVVTGVAVCLAFAVGAFYCRRTLGVIGAASALVAFVVMLRSWLDPDSVLRESEARIGVKVFVDSSAAWGLYAGMAASIVALICSAVVSVSGAAARSDSSQQV